MTKKYMINILKKAALTGADVLKKYYRQDCRVSYKKNIHDLVTQADQEAQNVIVSYIKKQMVNRSINNFGFIGEEGIYEKGEYMFIIDPLDGTMNFATGIDYFCVSIALAQNNQVISGVVYDVSKNNFYWAEKGRGAFKNEKKLIIPGNKKLSEAVMFFYFSSNKEKREHLLAILKQIGEHIRSSRLLGSVALDMCFVSEGIGDIVMDLKAHIWDIAASNLILEEAGGEDLDLKGEKIYLNVSDPQEKYQIIAGEKKLLKQLLVLLNK